MRRKGLCVGGGRGGGGDIEIRFPSFPISPPPSPITNPSRPVSHGREARWGSSLRLLRACSGGEDKQVGREDRICR